MATVDVLIPTCGRKTGLAIVLTSLLGQTFDDFDVVVSDQTPGDPAESYLESIELRTLRWALERRGHRVSWHRHLPQRGMAEQRQFLLEQSRSPYVHYLDDDVLLDPPTLGRMLGVLREEGCGFVGAPAPGLGFLGDVRPHEQAAFEPWDGPVVPEPFAPGAIPLGRHKVNNAATPLHLEARFAADGQPIRYKVAWIGGANVLYDRAKLIGVGGFSWWPRLPPGHAGEDMLAQAMLIRHHGGCGVLPAGTYHLVLPTTIPDRSSQAIDLLGELIAEEAAAGTAPTSGGGIAPAASAGHGS